MIADALRDLGRFFGVAAVVAIVLSIVFQFTSHRAIVGRFNDKALRVGADASHGQYTMPSELAGLPESLAVSTLVARTGAEDFSVLSHKHDRLVLRLIGPTRIGPTGSSAIAKVAWKVSPRSSSAIFNEAQVLSFLDQRNFKYSPRLIAVLPIDHGGIALLRDDIAGMTLHNYFKLCWERQDWPSVADVTSIITAISMSVSALHHLDVVHGDIKPGNLIATFDERRAFKLTSEFILIDFETSQGTHEEGRPSSGLSGTVGFMAPERIFATRPLKQSDVYSLASAAVFLLTGRPGRFGSSIKQRIPAELRELLRNSLDDDVYARPPDAGVWLSRWRASVRLLDRNTRNDRIRWPKEWFDNENLLTHTVGKLGSVLRPAARSRRLAEDIASVRTLTRVLSERVNSQLSENDRRFVRDLLDTDASLDDYAVDRKVAIDEVRRRLRAVYRDVELALASTADGELSAEPVVVAAKSPTIGSEGSEKQR